eukprot:CAMPEP_0181194194 /NCGR_PEP_ID=MMETSP1096-20121128/14210_1 /TAXON_ID=156174 ORGANISM="Chrysochromulina ericina, Strain CCMP281" /NCGR_SAMPLE_ID=MMETSP1096 /ASSEMBLY_ACC=CAM_ASM_000453 /LENGTH=138 /DNA_ID=CAMNT_0023283687 /DNA_START=751 /DNA_END=1163 /DNA_ORIENTATION=+
MPGAGEGNPSSQDCASVYKASGRFLQAGLVKLVASVHAYEQPGALLHSALTSTVDSAAPWACAARIAGIADAAELMTAVSAPSTAENVCMLSADCERVDYLHCPGKTRKPTCEGAPASAVADEHKWIAVLRSREAKRP